jgi:hypothetical protein
MSQYESSEKRVFVMLEAPSARAAMRRARLVTLLEPGTRTVASTGPSSSVEWLYLQLVGEGAAHVFDREVHARHAGYGPHPSASSSSSERLR